MQVDRVFVKTGFGLVTTGTVISGGLKTGDEVMTLPTGEKRKVRGIQSHGKTVQSVQMGDRAAVNIAGLSKEHVWRGSEIVSTGYLEPVTKFIANLSMIGDTVWKIKSKQRVRVHIGTSEILGRVTLPEKTLSAGETGNCVLSLEESVIAAMDDRFVLRSYSPMETIAGGRVLDPNPNGSWKEIRAWAKDLPVDPEQRYLQFINQSWRSPKSILDWSQSFHISQDDLAQILSPHTDMIDHLCITKGNINLSKDLFLEAIENFHQQNPYRAFIGLKFLQNQLQFSVQWFDIIARLLIKDHKIKHVESGFASASHEISFSTTDQEKATRVISALNRTENLALSESELISVVDASIVPILHAFKAQKKVIEIEAGLWMSNQTFQHIMAMVKTWFNSHTELTVPVFKDKLGLTRKTAIPILEYLDKKQFTERSGNIRLKGEHLE